MYDIYIGNTVTEELKLLYSFTEKEHDELFAFIDSIKYNNYKILNEIREYNNSFNFFTNEIVILKSELNYINEIKKGMVFSIALEKACNEAIKNDLELICSGEK